MLLASSSANFDVCSIDFVMYLLNNVSFSVFALIHGYCTLLSWDGFLDATTWLSLSFEIEFKDHKNHSQCYRNKFIANVSALFWCHFQRTVKDLRELYHGVD